MGPSNHCVRWEVGISWGKGQFSGGGRPTIKHRERYCETRVGPTNCVSRVGLPRRLVDLEKSRRTRPPVHERALQKRMNRSRCGCACEGRVSHVSTSSTSRSRGARESASPSDFRSPAPTPRETTSASERRSSTTYQTTLRETPVATGRIYAERTAFFDYQTTLRETYVATGRI